MNPQGRYCFVRGAKSNDLYFRKSKLAPHAKRHAVIWRHLRSLAFAIVLLGAVFVLDSLMLCVVQQIKFRGDPMAGVSRGLEDVREGHVEKETTELMMYGRLINLASAALMKVCNAVAVAVLLNATLVLPKFLYSSVWRDASQFGDIYQEDFFIDYLKDDVHIVKELPLHLQSLDLEAIGSQITDMDIMKEAEPTYFIEVVLPLLRRNSVVHFLGFGNRLAFDPLPLHLQTLRCKCNFHALKFVPKIQEIGSLLVRRIRKHDSRLTELDKQLFGDHRPQTSLRIHHNLTSPAKYLALHMRFEMDMVAYSLCDFGGGEKERKELQAYREIHFPTLVMRFRNGSVSPEELRNLGRCPLMPEEAALMLSALGYSRETYIYLAGSHIYGGHSRLLPFIRVYPNLVTKEDLLTTSELAPFRNFSSQVHTSMHLFHCHYQLLWFYLRGALI
ncbi:Uncharacterized protein ACMD2_21923 [Ananas comosus]|uniref:O-fucosyltransferase family protein n=1 Tax=Ananas comosus TaxID=4615 RepID=A0A199V411_ANACO|nr:Uncharacterized protein ACMD2_21923 [Ananas comosus]